MTETQRVTGNRTELVTASDKINTLEITPQFFHV